MIWTLGAAGDFIPVENIDAFSTDEKSKNYITGREISILNLEAPLLSDGKPSMKAGPVFKGNPDCVSLMTELGIDAVNLANNHMGDFGFEGIESTIRILSNHGIKTFGAGENFERSSEPLFIDVDTVRVGLIGCSEIQFGMSRRNSGGIYAPCFYQLFDSVCRTKKQCDVLVVSMHAGQEWSPWPSPKRVKMFRALVDSGVSVVIGHHSHVPQGYEKYGNGFIFYGLGNFWSPSFKSWNNRDNYHWGLLPVIKFKDDLIKDFEIRISKLHDDKSISIVELNENDSSYSSYIDMCNNALTNSDLLCGIWQEVSLRLYKQRYSKILGWRTDSLMVPLKEFLKILVRKSGLFRIGVQCRLKARDLSRWLVLSCFSQHDIISTALGVTSGELKDCRTQEAIRYVDQMMAWTTDS